MSDQTPVPEGDEALHVFADAAMILAEQARKMAGEISASAEASRLQIQEVLSQQKTFEEDRKASTRRSVLQVGVMLASGLALILAVVVSAAVILSSQNRTADSQRAGLTNVLSLLVDCTTPTPPATKLAPHPDPHVCYERGNQTTAIAIRQLQLGTLYANECALRNLTDGALLNCVNERLASAGIPPIQG